MTQDDDPLLAEIRHLRRRIDDDTARLRQLIREALAPGPSGRAVYGRVADVAAASGYTTKHVRDIRDKEVADPN